MEPQDNLVDDLASAGEPLTQEALAAYINQLYNSSVQTLNDVTLEGDVLHTGGYVMDKNWVPVISSARNVVEFLAKFCLHRHMSSVALAALDKFQSSFTHYLHAFRYRTTSNFCEQASHRATLALQSGKFLTYATIAERSGDIYATGWFVRASQYVLDIPYNEWGNRTFKVDKDGSKRAAGPPHKSLEEAHCRLARYDRCVRAIHTHPTSSEFEDELRALQVASSLFDEQIKTVKNRCESWSDLLILDIVNRSMEKHSRGEVDIESVRKNFDNVNRLLQTACSGPLPPELLVLIQAASNATEISAAYFSTSEIADKLAPIIEQCRTNRTECARKGYVYPQKYWASIESMARGVIPGTLDDITLFSHAKLNNACNAIDKWVKFGAVLEDAYRRLDYFTKQSHLVRGRNSPDVVELMTRLWERAHQSILDSIGGLENSIDLKKEHPPHFDKQRAYHLACHWGNIALELQFEMSSLDTAITHALSAGDEASASRLVIIKSLVIDLNIARKSYDSDHKLVELRKAAHTLLERSVLLFHNYTTAVDEDVRWLWRAAYSHQLMVVDGKLAMQYVDTTASESVVKFLEENMPIVERYSHLLHVDKLKLACQYTVRAAEANDSQKSQFLLTIRDTYFFCSSFYYLNSFRPDIQRYEDACRMSSCRASQQLCLAHCYELQLANVDYTNLSAHLLSRVIHLLDKHGNAERECIRNLGGAWENYVARVLLRDTTFIHVCDVLVDPAEFTIEHPAETEQCIQTYRDAAEGALACQSASNDSRRLWRSRIASLSELRCAIYSLMRYKSSGDSYLATQRTICEEIIVSAERLRLAALVSEHNPTLALCYERASERFTGFIRSAHAANARVEHNNYVQQYLHIVECLSLGDTVLVDLQLVAADLRRAYAVAVRTTHQSNATIVELAAADQRVAAHKAALSGRAAAKLLHEQSCECFENAYKNFTDAQTASKKLIHNLKKAGQGLKSEGEKLRARAEATL